MSTALNRTLALLAFGVAGYAAVAYGLLPLGALVHPAMKASFLSHAGAVYLHVFASALALACGPLQFSARLRTRRPRVHRWVGRAYLGIGVLLGGLSGLWLAVHAFGGPVAKTGFGLLALAWLSTGTAAYRAIRRGDVATHRQWMVCNFSLTFAAVTLRLYLPGAMAAGVPLEAAYPVIAWLCWVPNLAVGSWIARRSGLVPVARTA